MFSSKMEFQIAKNMLISLYISLQISYSIIIHTYNITKSHYKSVLRHSPFLLHLIIK